MNNEFYLNFPKAVPEQIQNRHPGIESQMNPRPVFEDPNYNGNNRLKDKVALITGGDSGIGRAVAVAFAKEGCNVAIIYYDEHDDAKYTKEIVEKNGRQCLLLPGDISDDNFCSTAVKNTMDKFNKIDILVNNAGVQFTQNSIEDITNEQLERTFKTNIFSMFYLTRAALPYLNPGSSIINTSSITAYSGNETLLDYSCTKGAIVSFTRSMALSLIGRNIRVNAVAPGPVWTSLIPSSFSAEKVGKFGSNSPIKRPAQPVEIAPAYVFLASPESSYVTGEIIHINGGQFIGG
ncbi:SDR family oxidoreductase [Clostridium sp. BJN0013]|uniref:SDR family oxidoreductase n=1 Tax=Clostridium sp. BJN0013 TaxID=3236840 RepID=UPI0034C5C6CD